MNPQALFEPDLAAELLARGGARFQYGHWSVGHPEGVEVSFDATIRRTRHEELHQTLNDLTTFGLLLQLAVELTKEPREEPRAGPLLTRLVARCRLTQEVFATYLSGESLLRDRVPDELTSSPEYSWYFEIGAELASRLPNRALGVQAVCALVRIAMSPRLPEEVITQGIRQFSLNSLRASDSPDERFLQAIDLLDRNFWVRAAEAARMYFHRHPDWDEYFGTYSSESTLRKFVRIEPSQVPGVAAVLPGGIDEQLDRDVANFMIDQACFELEAKGMICTTGREQRSVEVQLRQSSGIWVPRPLDLPEELERHKWRRLYFGERLIWRISPLATRVTSLEQMGPEDWVAFGRILRSEGFLPIYIRTREDVLANHSLDSPESLGKAPVLCFLRKQRFLEDGSIGLDLYLIENPANFLSLMSTADHYGGKVGLTLSGQVLTHVAPETTEYWLSWIDGMAVSILLDSDPASILSRLIKEWEVLAWHIEKLSEGGGQEVLFLFSLGGRQAPPLAFFRPANYHLADAALHLFDPPAIPLSVKHTGANILGISTEFAQAEWTFPLHAVWAAKRYLNEECQYRALRGDHGFDQ